MAARCHETPDGPKCREIDCHFDPFQWSMVSFPTAHASREEIATTGFNPVKRPPDATPCSATGAVTAVLPRSADHPADARGAALNPAAAARLEPAGRYMRRPAAKRPLHDAETSVTEHFRPTHPVSSKISGAQLNPMACVHSPVLVGFSPV